MGGDFEFGCKIKTTHPGVHPTICNLALSPKQWLQWSHLDSKPKIGDFEHIGKVQPIPPDLGDGNKTYCG